MGERATYVDDRRAFAREPRTRAFVATVARGAVIVAVACWYALRYAVGAIARAVAIRGRARRLAARGRARGRVLRAAFERLGATFVKVGQVMSSRPDVFAPEVIAELRGLQDQVHPFPFARVRAVVEAAHARPLADTFAHFAPTPLAAGSIAQVHRAALRDGTEVAVKVLRPGVRACVHRDAALILALARVAEWVSPRARAAEVRAHARALVAGILAQTDLRHEAVNYARFRADFEGEDVAFPLVHAVYSTSDVLVMELVHGVPLARAPEVHHAAITRVLRDTFFTMCFDTGLVHADLHPGNILVREDGVVVLLDVGLVKQLGADTRDIIVDFARCLVLGDARDLVAHLRAHHAPTRPVDWTEVARDVETFVARLRARTIAELEAGALVAQLFALARKHGIRPLPELSLVLLGIVTIEGIAKQLEPSANMLAEVAAYLAPRIAAPRGLARGSRRWPRRSFATIAIAPPPNLAEPTDGVPTAVEPEPTPAIARTATIELARE